MCRWIAYKGETIALEHYVTEPSHSLVSQSIHALESTVSINGDGFGLGWYGAHPEPGLYREVRPAWSDDNLRYLCRHLRSHLFFAHVRAATGTAIARPNCHPFAAGGWMFMHNGFVGSWARHRRAIEAMISDEFYPSRTGTTDSEAVFLAIMSAGARRDPVGATLTTLTKISARLGGANPQARFRFTSALTNGRDLYAFRYAANDAANTLYYQTSAAGTIVVSEPLDEQRANWTPVPENHVLIARDRQPLQVVSIPQSLPASVH